LVRISMMLNRFESQYVEDESETLMFRIWDRFNEESDDLIPNVFTNRSTQNSVAASEALFAKEDKDWPNLQKNSNF
jgi:hypothetical protein